MFYNKWKTIQQHNYFLRKEGTIMLVTEELTLYKVCQNSVRFDNKQSEVLKSIYVPNDSVRKLDEPKKIKVTIEKVG